MKKLCSCYRSTTVVKKHLIVNFEFIVFVVLVLIQNLQYDIIFLLEYFAHIELQKLGLYLAHVSFHQGGMFLVPHMLAFTTSKGYGRI